nr:phosphoribosyltransferase family protein [Paenactinomyces guangxiensis]
MGKRLGLPVVPLLERCKSTSSQSQRSRQERLLALKNVFRLGKEVNRKQIANKTILIVDDVYTTGTTLRECAKPLRQAGVNDVCSVTFAR